MALFSGPQFLGPLFFGPFRLDREAAALSRESVAVAVQPKVFDLLAFFVVNPGVIWSRDQLLRRLWPGVHVSEDSLHQLLRKARRALGDEADDPVYIEAVARRGWRFRAEVHAEAGGSGTAGGSTGAPSSAAGFQARPEREDLVCASLEARLVAVHGPAGAGKTRLVKEALPEATVVTLETARTVEDLVRLVASAIGVPLETATVDRWTVILGRALANRGALTVVLDHADALADTLGGAVAGWLLGAPSLRIVVTSRQRIVGVATVVAVGPLAPEAARALFVTRAAEARPSFVPDEHLDAVLAHLGGLPLAIELAARRVRVLGLDEIATRLTTAIGVLSSPDGSSLPAALRSSVEALTPADQAVLLAACVFPGPFSLADLAALSTEIDPVDALDRLADASLVSGAPGAFFLLEPIRTHALAQLGGEEALRGHSERWVGMVVQAATALLPGYFRWDTPSVRALAGMAGTLVVAWRRCDPQSAERLRVARALAAALRYGGPWSVARDALESAVAAASLDGAVPADVWALLGEYRIRVGDAAGGLDALDVALSHPQAGPTTAAYASFLSARVRHAMGQAEAAADLAAAALSHARAAENPALIALAHDASGFAAAASGDLSAMRAHYDAAIATCVSPDQALVRGLVTHNYGACLGRSGHHEEALVWFARSLEDLCSAPFPHLRAASSGNLGLGLFRTGRGRDAEPVLREAAALARSVGDAAAELPIAGALGEVLSWRGEHEEARVWFARAEALTDPADENGRSDVERRAGLRAWAAGFRDLARARFTSAAKVGDPGQRTEAKELLAALDAPSSAEPNTEREVFLAGLRRR